MNVRSALGPVIFAGAFLPVPALVGGQAPARFEVVPRLGVYAPTREVGPAAHAAGPWYLRLERIDAAPAFELEGRVTWPGAHVATRLVGLATLPANVSGYFDCYPGLACPAILLPSDAEAMVLAAALDVVVSPLDPGGTVRPFLVAGGCSSSDELNTRVLGDRRALRSALPGREGLRRGVRADRRASESTASKCAHAPRAL